MRVGSLFAGIGGFDLAAERAGMELAWSAEVDKHASAVLDHHWPVVKNLGDVHEITGPPAVDVLTGGFPCQDYSVAGVRRGLAGDRGALWWDFHRLIAELNPTWIVGENVPGLLSSRGGRDFATIVDSLVELGYGVVWRVLDAQWFGVAQRRRRVFIVGHSGGQPRPEVLALGQSMSGDTPPSRETGSGVAALTANGLGGGGPDDNLAQAGHLISFDWQAGGDHTSSGAFNEDGSTPTLGTVGRLAFAQNQRDEVRTLDQAGSLNAERWGTAKNETLLATLQEVGARESKNQNGVGIGIADPEIRFTLQAGQQHGIATTSTVRRLTPLECERLQGFPDQWTGTPGNSDTQRYRQLGNAVAVPVAEWIMRKLSLTYQETT